MLTLDEIRHEADVFIRGAEDVAVRQKGRRPQIDFDFDDRAIIGGRCGKEGDLNFIHLPRHQPVMLESLFFDLVRTGVPMQKLAELADQDWGIDELVLQLSREANRSIFLHELAHVMNGHLGLIEEQDSTGERLDYLSLQALEMDADCYAASLGLSQIVARLEQVAPGLGIIAPDTFAQARSMLFVWGFATYAIFRHFVNDDALDDLFRLQATPPQIRMYQSLVALNSCIIGRKDGTSFIPPSPALEFLDSKVLGPAGLAVEEARSVAEGQPKELRFVAQALDGRAQRLMFKKLPNAWAGMQPRLERHAFVTIAPPRPVPQSDLPPPRGRRPQKMRK